MSPLSKTFITMKSISHLNKTIGRGIKIAQISNNVTAAKTTIDTSHVEKHSQQAQGWWDPNGPMKALHSYNLIRIPFIRDGLVSCSLDERTLLPLSNKVILDVGCGGGIVSEGIARLGAKVTGIDASKELVEIAKEHCTIDSRLENNRPSYHCTTVEEHSQHFFDHYDAVVASEVIEHVADKELFIQSCVKALKPGGKIFITTPNRSKLSEFVTICLSEHVFNLVPKGTHEYDKFTTPTEVTFLLERNNCHVQLVHGIMYYPVINKWAWTSSPLLIFALQAVKLAE
ncbi:ubiquinone biosynthesis O-methyltransferase, mitochondrial-like [Vanessa tameamea]|uniref:Ubiquinone biosynthesis O-methyltransferase, mitochondrial n=1 Tax=Vanessa tameamea TaxID=334116 RepID=A0ABM4AM37_VANTA|nr:ubiquinone biosynthesis O-methyltransferase, mitochondrial-like [Vanessa tameamea]